MPEQQYRDDLRMPANELPRGPVVNPTRAYVQDRTQQGKGEPEQTQPTRLFEQQPLLEVDPLPNVPQEANNMAVLIAKVNAQQDIDRIKVGCSLLNVFNFAIQVQANREQWQPSDYRRFIVALQAVDGVGIDAIQDEETTRLTADVEREMRRHG